MELGDQFPQRADPWWRQAAGEFPILVFFIVGVILVGLHIRLDELSSDELDGVTESAEHASPAMRPGSTLRDPLGTAAGSRKTLPPDSVANAAVEQDGLRSPLRVPAKLAWQ